MPFLWSKLKAKSIFVIYILFIFDSESKMSYDPRFKVSGLGHVSGLAAISNEALLVFHWGSREDRVFPFDDENRLWEEFRTPIRENTLYVIDTKSGHVTQEMGANMFYIPHGLTIDSTGAVWMTDAGAHQVFKFASLSDIGNDDDNDNNDNALSTLSAELSLGERFVPGADATHFCRPSDIAVRRDGSFFVADAGCEPRVALFAPDGTLLWRISSLLPLTLPHSLTLDQDQGVLYVADRLRGVVQIFDAASGVFDRIIDAEENDGEIFAIEFSEKNKCLYLVKGPSRRSPAKGLTISGSKVVDSWTRGDGGFGRRPHDVAVTPNGRVVFVGELGPNRVTKFRATKLSRSTDLVT